MSIATADNLDCGSFFDRVSSATERILLLDYDGTLAPFTTDRNHAYPYAGVRELLHPIMTRCGTRLVIVTGRPARSIASLLQLNPEPETWGTHGIERLHPNGRYEKLEVEKWIHSSGGHS